MSKQLTSKQREYLKVHLRNFKRVGRATVAINRYDLTPMRTVNSLVGRGLIEIEWSNYERGLSRMTNAGFLALGETSPTRDDTCHADRDGDCDWEGCPQLRDGEPKKSGRHCPLDRAASSVERTQNDG